MTHDPRRPIYLSEYNVLMNGSTYLPLVSGLLRANAETSEVVRERFRFAPFLFHRDQAHRLVDRHQSPAVAAFSMLMWNAQLSQRVAREVKQRWPDTLVIAGGASVPHEPDTFFAQHPYFDVTVRGEGEHPFRAILERLATARGAHDVDLDGLAGVSWRTPRGEVRHGAEEPAAVRDLDAYPSPYLEGLYDDLIAAHPELAFQAIIETNRGCPFQCTFCYWGKGGLSRKYRFHGIERVQREIDWMAEHQIRYVFNADSNFGMHRRDMEIAEYLVATKQRTGFPHKFRTCYGKNTDEKIFAIGKLFHEHGLEKGITISYQSVDEQVQANIKRDNIKLDRARELQRRFNDSGVPVYTELILGLPGESYETWRQGVNRVLASGLQNQLFMYLCQVFPNTDLASPAYLQRFGMVTKTIELTEIHGKLREPGSLTECEEIVVASDTMPLRDWREAVVFSWVTMAMHSLKLGFYVMAWLVDRLGITHGEFLEFLARGEFDPKLAPRWSAELAVFRSKLDALLAGQGRGCVLREYGDLYWDEEEACFLRLSGDFDGFVAELRELTLEFLEQRGICVPVDELDDVLRYQDLALPRPHAHQPRRARFEHRVHEYFAALFSSTPEPLRRGRCVIEARQVDFAGDLPRFARESILWGRKSGTMLTTRQVTSQPTEDPIAAATPT